jgi:hypothetical protein
MQRRRERATARHPVEARRQRPLFDWAVDWKRLPVARIEFDLKELALGFGPEAYWTDQQSVVHGWRFQVPIDTEAEIAALDAWFDGLTGRLVGFWLPMPIAAFEIVAGVSATQFKVREQGLAATLADGPELQVWFTKTGQAIVAAKVAGVEDNGDGTETVTLATAAGTFDASWQAWVLQYVRLADDTERGTFNAEQRLMRNVSVVELPHEYAELETGSRPIYLYHFFTDQGGSKVDWRLTSFACDFTSIDGAWTAARITHQQLTHNTRGDRPEVLVDAEFTPANPLFQMCPSALAMPLNLTIRAMIRPTASASPACTGRSQDNPMGFGDSGDAVPTEKPKTLGLDPSRMDNQEQGRPLPYLAGTFRIGGTFLAEAWNVRSEEIRKKVGKKKEVKRNIDGYMVCDEQGRFGVGLVRGPAGNEPTLDEDNLIEPPSIDAVSWWDTVNEVYVRFSNRARKFADDSVSWRDRGSDTIIGTTRRRGFTTRSRTRRAGDLIRKSVQFGYSCVMSFVTVEVVIDHGRVVPRGPEELPEKGSGLLTILQPVVSRPGGISESLPPRVELPLIRGDGQRLINPTPEELDASLWGP